MAMVMACAPLMAVAQTVDTFEQDDLKTNYRMAQWENQYKRPAPFAVKDSRLVWSNVTSSIRFIMFRRNMQMVDKSAIGISVVNGGGAVDAGLAVFDSEKVNAEKPGNGFFFGIKQGKLNIVAFVDGKKTDIAVPEVKVNTGVKLKITREGNNFACDYDNGKGWQSFVVSELFKVSASVPVCFGIFGASGWWKGTVQLDDFSMENCAGAELAAADAECLVVTDANNANAEKLLELWQREFAGLKIKCAVRNDITALEENTDLSKFKFMVISMRRCTEGFARNVERWVANGGVAVLDRYPEEYIPPASSRLKKYDSQVKPFFKLWQDSDTRPAHGMTRVAPVIPYGSKARVLKIAKTDNSEMFNAMKASGILEPKDVIETHGLLLVTGWPDRGFGDMALLNAEFAGKDDKNEVKTVAVRHRYGQGRGYYSSLNISENDDFATALRSGLMKQIVADAKAPADVPKSLFNSPPGLAVTSAVKEKPEVPGRPAPPGNCILELQGDEFSCSLGSPSWAPWRVAVSHVPTTPIEKTFSLPANAGASGGLWMEIKAAYGDHTDPSLIELTFNGKLLMKRVSPWSRIQYSAKYYNSMYPVSFFIPAELVKDKNNLSFINHGPDWFLVDYVRFFPADAEQSLAATLDKDQCGTFECRVQSGNVKIDGIFDEPVWAKASWKSLGEEKDKPSSFAFAADDKYLYIGMKSWYKQTVAEFALAFPGCKNFYLFSFDQSDTTFARNRDDEILPLIPLESKSVSGENGSIHMEARLPLACVPADFSAMVYRQKSKKVMPLGGVADFSVFRRSFQLNGKDDAVWYSFLPFMFKGERVHKLEREYKTRVPYHYMYDNVEDGLLYNISVNARPVSWNKLKWGGNSISVDNSSSAYASAKVVVRAPGQPRVMFEYKLKKSAHKLDFTIDFPGRNEISVQIFDASGKLTALDMRPAEIERPFNLKLDRSYYTTEDKAVVHMSLNYPEDFKRRAGKVYAELLRPDGEIVRADCVYGDDSGTFTFPLAGMADGEYSCFVNANIVGRSYRVAAPVLRKLAPAKTEVKLRHDGFSLVNGKPFFPMGILVDRYNVNPDITFVKEGGLNMAMVWKKVPQEIWDKAAKENIMLSITTVGTHNGAGDWLVDYNGTREHVESIRNNPALFGYYPIDEPEYWHAPNCVPIQLQRFNDFTKDIDPYRPSMISHGVGSAHYCASEGMTFNDVVDIRIWECYGKPRAIVERMDEMKTVGRNDKAVSWAFLKLGPGWSFAPVDPSEFRANVYAAFVSGCRGIVFFMGSTARWTGGEVWPEASKEVSSEIQQIATERMKESSVELDVSTGNQDVRAMAWRDGKNLYLTVVNISDKQQEMKISFKNASLKSGKYDGQFQEMPQSVVSRNDISSTLKRYAVGCWKIALR